MSYYYGYDYYGTEAYADYYYYEEPVEMDDEKDGMMPVKIAYGLIPVLDLYSYYVNNDKWGTTNDDWKSVYNMALAQGVFKLVTFGAAMAVPAVHDNFMPIAALGVVLELVQGYLINTAHGTPTSDTSSTKVAVAAVVYGSLVGGAVAAMSMPEGDDDYEEYYYEEVADDTTGGDDYYSYYYY